MSETSPIVIIGTGLAGYNTAREIRRNDKETPLVMITADDGAYYSKPSLSSALSHNKTPDDLAIHSAQEMGEQLNATILTYTTVTTLDATAQTMTLHNGEVLSYRDCVLAVGATPTPLPVEGEQSGVIHINNRLEYITLREQLKDVKKVAILGAGLIGSEFANDLSKSGFDVTLISRSDMPLNRLLPEQTGQSVIAALEAQQATYIGGASATRIAPAAEGGYTITLDNGQTVHSEVIISAIGLKPNLELATQIGATVNHAICTDEYLETSVPHVYATGDCAEIVGQCLQFVMPLMHQSRALGATLAGNRTPLKYPLMPVSVKSASPVTVLNPTEAGEWTVEGQSPHFKAICKDSAGKVIGWALTGDCTALRRDMMALMR